MSPRSSAAIMPWPRSDAQGTKIPRKFRPRILKYSGYSDRRSGCSHGECGGSRVVGLGNIGEGVVGLEDMVEVVGFEDRGWWGFREVSGVRVSSVEAPLAG